MTDLWDNSEGYCNATEEQAKAAYCAKYALSLDQVEAKLKNVWLVRVKAEPEQLRMELEGER